MTITAKIFVNGRSQAVRLPAAYCFDTKEVFIRQDAETGDVILSRKPPNWDGFFAARKAASMAGKIPKDFLDKDDPDQDQGSYRSDPFAGWCE
jgi:antitoxin VapB